MNARMLRAAQQGQSKNKFKLEMSIKSFAYSSDDI